ncbi:MAG: cupredoxin domain-containing protein [Solirubrobacterales bacterium]
MRRPLALAALIGVAVVLLIASVATGRGTKTVDVGDDFFDPASLEVKKDTKVSFNWGGTDEHDIVKVKGPGKFFESGAITGSGVQFRHKFKKSGRYKLICSIHEEMKMKLEVD